MNLRILTDAELVQHALNEQNDLTTSALEIELTKRLAAKLDEEVETRPLLGMLDEQHIFTTKDLRTVLDKSAYCDELEESLAEIQRQIERVLN